MKIEDRALRDILDSLKLTLTRVSIDDIKLALPEIRKLAVQLETKLMKAEN